MSTMQILDAPGRRRSPATLPGFHAGRPPRNKGFRYPPDPPEIIGVMRQAGESDHGLRLRTSDLPACRRLALPWEGSLLAGGQGSPFSSLAGVCRGSSETPAHGAEQEYVEQLMD